MDQRVVPNSCLDTAKVVEERYNPAKDVVLAAAQADHSKANDVAEALMQNLLDDAVTAMTPKSLPVVQSPPTSIKPDNSPIIPNITDSEMSNSEQVVAFARDLLTNHLPADKTINGKFLKAPVIPNVALESMKIDKRGAYILNRYPLIFDATNEALQEVFEPHYRYYESQLRHLHRKRMLPPRGLTHEQVIESAIKHVRQWADYKEDHGENLDSLLIGEVHAAEKRWKDRSEFDEQVKEAVFQDLWEHLLDDTVATVQRI
ncbi:hypothetical protein DFS34DRAFT_626387 [Phlyctochytrium arcticum]|nr:hypothetical protein DFS34DRAFT_626387 [Phlyctochytrium arcticum]